MTSKRVRVANFYSNDPSHRITAAAATNRYILHAPQIALTAVVRLDLNGYSRWARDRPIVQRAHLLDEYFSWTVPLLEELGGLYYRDEGDCIIALFGGYWNPATPTHRVLEFSKAVVSHEFGELTAKASVAIGNVAFFQKSHEVESDDWSAEGDPFVRAVRLEQAVESRQHINFFFDEYHQHIQQHATYRRYRNEPCYWLESALIKRQVPGLGNAGGWSDTIAIQYSKDGY